jgi:hypothetical protein
LYNNDLSKHSFGNPISLNSYTEDNKYTAPSDGYVVVNSGSQYTDPVSAVIGDSVNRFDLTINPRGTYQGNALFVHKGTMVYARLLPTGSNVAFYSLE